MKVESSSSEIMDAEVALAAEAVLDSARRRDTARASRDSARTDRLELLKRSAEKLRELADWALGSKALKLAQYLNSKGSIKEAAVEVVGEQGANAVAGGVGLVCELDPFEVATNYARVDQKELDTEAQVASDHEEDCDDGVADAERRQSEMLGLMEKVSDGLHAARMAVLRG